MQTNFFAFFARQSVDQAAAEATPQLAAPVELDLATLEHVGGAGPAGTWALQSSTLGPAGTW